MPSALPMTEIFGLKTFPVWAVCAEAVPAASRIGTRRDAAPRANLRRVMGLPQVRVQGKPGAQDPRPRRRRLRGRERRRTSGESGKNRCGILAVGARLRGRARERRSEKEGRGGGRQEIRDGARRARVIVLWNEGRVR